jgi:hypothetical protein
MTKVGVIIPTCNPDRQMFLDNLMNRLSRQTYKPDYVVRINYPNNTDKPDLTKRYREGYELTKKNGCDLTVFMEDDDYYPLTYLEDMKNEWEKNNKPDLLGNWPTRYYHIGFCGFRIYEKLKHCSAHCTALGENADLNVCEDTAIFDLFLWEKNLERSVKINLQDKHFPVSIKHGIGMTAGRKHGERKYEQDRNFEMLKKWVDNQEFSFLMDMRSLI